MSQRLRWEEPKTGARQVPILVVAVGTLEIAVCFVGLIASRLLLALYWTWQLSRGFQLIVGAVLSFAFAM